MKLSGSTLHLNDLKHGLFWQLFEYKPRPTRLLSSYFEILDTKFRSWAWHFIMPHPSLSLTWAFSLLLAPLFLYLLLRNLGISSNIALMMTAFYLVTPGALSLQAMLFRPAKPMTNFAIILCLYLASRLKKILDRGRPIPAKAFLMFWTVCAVSFYWDETALLIFPAILCLFSSIFRRKLFLGLWFLLPLLTTLVYLKIIPYICVLAGYDQPSLLKYDLFQSVFHSSTIHAFIKYLWMNSKSLILQTIGIFYYSKTTPIYVKVSLFLAIFSWMAIIFCHPRMFLLGIQTRMLAVLIFLLLFFNATMSITMLAWGPYYYGAFWSIFFVLFLAQCLEKAQLPKPLLLGCFLLIMISMVNCFIGTNIIYKKYHWYPYDPATIGDYFKGTRLFFDKQDKPVFSGEELRSEIQSYWKRVRNKENIVSLSIPRELGWLTAELEPEKFYERSKQSPYFYTYRAYPERKQELFTQATRDFGNIATGINPPFPQAYNDRGSVYFKQGHLQEAISDFRRAIELKPDFEDAYFNLGLVYYKTENLNQAFLSFNKACELNPKDSEACSNRIALGKRIK
jgi:tetratricopeptide (TPR) repeat protein